MFEAPDPTPRPHRPGVYAHLTGWLEARQDQAGEADPDAATNLVRQLLSSAQAPGGVARLVALPDEVGIDALAQLWRGSSPGSLPCAMLTLYLMRQWCRSHSQEVIQLWRGGVAYAPVDAVVAGVGAGEDADAIGRFADDTLAGAFGGDFGVGLDRAAAFFRVMAAGRREHAELQNLAAVQRRDHECELAERNDATAQMLARAARAWRGGELN